MKTAILSILLLGATAAPALAQSSGGGDREPAGGAFMSSYSRNPYEPDRRFPQAAEPRAGYDADGPVATGSVRRSEHRSRPR